MADEVRLIATKDIPGIQARLPHEQRYGTRRLKAGDEFFAKTQMGELIVNAMKRAEYLREPGKVAPPPAEVTERAAAATPQRATTATPKAATQRPTSRSTTRKRRAPARKPATKKG